MADNVVDAHLEVTKKPKTIDTAITSIVVSPDIPLNNSIVIDIFDIGYTQTHLLSIYNKLTEISGTAMDFLKSDIWNQKAVEVGANVWESGKKSLTELMKSASQLELEQIQKDALAALQKQIDELTNVNLLIERQVASIQLPMPNGVMDKISHHYTEDELNLIESVINKGSSMLGGMAEKLIQTDVKLAKRKNFTYDPNNIIVYQGTALREYDFDIQVLPQSSEEVKNIVKAIKYLKKWSSAQNISLKTYDDAFLTMSGIFRIRFPDMISKIMDIRLEDMFYLTDIGISYSGADRIQRFHDGTPKHMILSLKLRERLPQYFNENDKVRINNYKTQMLEVDMDNSGGVFDTSLSALQPF